MRVRRCPFLRAMAPLLVDAPDTAGLRLSPDEVHFAALGKYEIKKQRERRQG
jgi:hypothetical protein